MLLEDLINKKVLVVVVALWLPAVGYGLHSMLQYANTPGTIASPPQEWPSGSRVPFSRRRPTMLVFAHPQCPCSRATLGELAWIMTQASGRVDATVFFYLPHTEKKAWATTDLWRTAVSIPGVHAVVDPDGVAARSFGVTTSGQTLLYNAAGRLMFNGGITIARSHSGSNDGREAIVTLVAGGVPPRRTTPVFGCSLFTSDSHAQVSR